jgi:hypothetical protein
MTRFRRFASFAASVCLAVAFCGAAGAQEETAQPEETSHKLQIRNYDHFEYDTTTGTYFGIATFYTKDNSVVFKGARADTDVEAVTGEFRLVYGGEMAQFGVMIPYHFTSGNDLGSGENDVGDIRTHLKAIPLRTEFVDLGGALQITFPAGSESDGTSTGNIGILPFGTGTVHLGPVDLNGHFGYEFINNERPNGSSESFLYGGSLKVGILDNLGALLELPVQTFTARKNRTVAAIQPGLMYQIPINRFALLLSLSGSYTFTGGTAGDRGGQASRWGLNTKSGLSRGEWGIGGAIGTTFD